MKHQAAHLSPIYRDAKRLLVLIEQVVRQFSRYHRYTLLGADLRQQAMTLLRLVHKTWRDKRKQTQFFRYQYPACQLLIQKGFKQLSIMLREPVNAVVNTRETGFFRCGIKRREVTPIFIPHSFVFPRSLAMKRVISLVMLLVGSLLSSATSVAACRADIDIGKPDSLYTDPGDGTVIDKQTGLMWRKCSLGLSGSQCAVGNALTLTWQVALAAANDNIDYQYIDWRLPNINELASLLEDACITPAINASVFPNTANDFYWSSSPYAGVNGNAWDADFSYGSVYFSGKYFPKFVRLVRDSQ